MADIGPGDLAKSTDPAAFWGRVDAFAAALSRLIDLAALFTTVADGSDVLPLVSPVDPPIDPLVVRAFEEADAARYEIGPYPPRRPPSHVLGIDDEYMAASSSFHMYHVALVAAWGRWGCTSGFFERDGRTWFGRAYPPDFPGFDHYLWPIELATLKAALVLARYRPAETSAPAKKVDPPLFAEGSQAKIFWALGYESKNYPGKLRELAQRGAIRLEEIKPTGRGRSRWKVWILDPDKLDRPVREANGERNGE